MLNASHALMISASRSAWLHVIAVILSLGIFTATFLAYFERHEMHAPGSFLPMILGCSSFFVTMCALLYLGTPSRTTARRIAIAVSVALGETVVFLNLVMFLLVNTIGS